MTLCAARFAVARPGTGPSAVGYVNAESVAPGRRLRLAYADPLNLGKAPLYRDRFDDGSEATMRSSVSIQGYL